MVFSFINLWSHFRNRTMFFFFLPYSYPPYITIRKTCKINFLPVATVITVKGGQSYPCYIFSLIGWYIPSNINFRSNFGLRIGSFLQFSGPKKTFFLDFLKICLALLSSYLRFFMGLLRPSFMLIFNVKGWSNSDRKLSLVENVGVLGLLSVDVGFQTGLSPKTVGKK